MSLFDRLPQSRMVDARDALSGRGSRPFSLGGTHTVLGTPIMADTPTGYHEIVVGMGCFWGAERIFWRLPGVWTTAVGYAGGYTTHPTYDEVCSGRTGHAEVVRVVYDPQTLSLTDLLKAFFEEHDPTQGMRQGNDLGTQYRSAIYTTGPEQLETVRATRDTYEQRLTSSGHGRVTTEIAPLSDFYYAEDYHQQYLSDVKNPNGYCGLAGTGVSCPTGIATA